MASLIRTSLLIVALSLSACGGSQAGSGDAALNPTASPNGSASPNGVASSIETSAPAMSAAPIGTSSAAPAATSSNGATDLAHTVSVSVGAAPPPSVSAVPMAPPTAAELELIAMCTGKKSIFSEKELKLLNLADKSDNPAMREQADAIRSRRKEAIEISCNMLRGEGKL